MQSDQQKQLLNNSLKETQRLDALCNNILLASQLDLANYQQNKQIKPFSEEKLKQLWYETKNIMGWYSFQEIAKLIEKSHGIE